MQTLKSWLGLGKSSEPAHAQRLGALAIDELERGIEDAAARQPLARSARDGSHGGSLPRKV